MKAPFPDIKKRIVDYVRSTGKVGVTKSQLLQRYQKLRSADLDAVLTPLVTEGHLKQQTDAKAYALGRPAVRFFAPEVELALTAPEKPAMPIHRPLEPLPARSTPCKVCGAAIPMPETGHPYVYCSDACKRASRDGGATLKDFLARATDARIFARAALCLVMADLSIRGFQIAGDVFGPALRLIVHDNTGLLFLDVVVIPDSGHFPPPENYDSAAFVYRDGRIVYTGRTPLVQEDAQPTGDANVEPGSGSEI
jgi:predicted nucleic acid-binding Zn ribbon protein